MTNPLKYVSDYHTLRLKVKSGKEDLTPAEMSRWLKANEDLRILRTIQKENRETSDERRKLQRYTFEQVVSIQTEGQQVFGISRNISYEGIFIETNTKLNVGDRVIIKITEEGENKRHFFFGRVVRITEEKDESGEPVTGIGIKFEDRID